MCLFFLQFRFSDVKGLHHSLSCVALIFVTLFAVQILVSKKWVEITFLHINRCWASFNHYVWNHLKSVFLFQFIWALQSHNQSMYIYMYHFSFFFHPSNFEMAVSYGATFPVIVLLLSIAFTGYLEVKEHLVLCFQWGCAMITGRKCKVTSPRSYHCHPW